MSIRLFLLLILIPTAFASDIVLPDPLQVESVTYRGAIYSKHDGLKLTFFHETGIATIPIHSLPSKVKEAIGYTPQKAAEQRKVEYEAQQASAERARQRAAKIENFYGILKKKTSIGWIAVTRKATGEQRVVSYWNSNLTRHEQRTEDVYVNMEYEVYGHPNFMYFTPDQRVSWKILPEKVIHIDGEPIVRAKFIQEL